MKVLFTHDLHDRIDSFNIIDQGEIKNIGGYSRLYTKIKEEIDPDRDLLLDGGDFSMGTLYQTIYEEEAPSLRLLTRMGYDLVSLGNHEFDFRAEGLARSLINAKKLEGDLVDIVLSNGDFTRREEKEEVRQLEEAFDYLGIRKYKVIEKAGQKIGVFALMGREAIGYAPMAGIDFKDYVEVARKIVKELKFKNVDMIICLSHSGTNKDRDKSEDELLAREVPEIDLIISAHTHTILKNPISIDNTHIVSCGKYGRYLGIVDLEKSGERWNIGDYRLEEIDNRIEKNKEIEAYIGDFKSKVQYKYLDNFKLSFDQEIGYAPKNFTSSSRLGKEYAEEPLGNLIADSFIYMVKKTEGESYEPVDLAIVPSGTIRDSFLKGPISVSHIFNVSSLGVGPDGLSGYPLVSVYLTGEDLKLAVEIDASISPILNAAQLYISGLSYEVNPNKMIFNRASKIRLEGANGLEKIENKKLYRVVAGLYTGQMLALVSDMSMGALKIIPRDSQARPVESLEDHIVYLEDKEVKEWYALASYINSFPKGEIPESYYEVRGRKKLVDDKSLLARLKNPNKIIIKLMFMLGAILVIIIILFKYFLENSIKNKI